MGADLACGTRGSGVAEGKKKAPVKKAASAKVAPKKPTAKKTTATG
jgi:hypothetical protein